MKPLNKLQSAIFIVGALLLVAGAVATLFWRPAAPYIFAVGALCYTSMQLQQRYEGSNVTLRRLRRIVILSDVLLLVTALLLLAGNGNPLGLDWFTYASYIRNNWVVVLLIAAIMQLYTVFRISAELEREAKKR